MKPNRGPKPAIALTIAGSDPSGGAGIQADLKTFHQFGCYGQAVITLLTVQNTQGVTGVAVQSALLVRQQLEAVLADMPPAAAKTGALGDPEIIRTLAEMAKSFVFPLVVDPVMISKHGAPLLAEEARTVLAQQMLPVTTLLTPNLHETEALVGYPVQSLEEMRQAGKQLLQMGCRAVLVKGGHRDGDATDILVLPNKVVEFTGKRVDTRHTHGTGCTYSAAITALLSQGVELEEAVRQAKRFIAAAISTNPGLGHGQGPVNHFAPTTI